ncbi:hypothetical protein KC19_4G116700 [Ceratodon purpureus]|uniref:Uncharacterized protein n=1 Tax=Ceratodon purpureus TaxID=3225 RepID=A0A8T0IB06_CERPU|nr:hypothetical protein KC19_4G116700 [Ceratodon purpureus]
MGWDGVVNIFNHSQAFTCLVLQVMKHICVDQWVVVCRYSSAEEENG